MSGLIFARLRPMAQRMSSPVLRNNMTKGPLFGSQFRSPLQYQSPFVAWNVAARFYATKKNVKKKKLEPLDQRPGEEIDLSNPPAVKQIKKTSKTILKHSYFHEIHNFWKSITLTFLEKDGRRQNKKKRRSVAYNLEHR